MSKLIEKVIAARKAIEAKIPRHPMKYLPQIAAAMVFAPALCVAAAIADMSLLIPPVGLGSNNVFTGNNTFTGALQQFGSGTGAPTHIASGQTTAPALTSCGTSPSIAGTDTAGVVTVKTTTCTITFNVAYTTAPVCLVIDETTPSTSMAYTVSTTAITISAGLTSSDKVQYACIGQSGG